MRNEPKSKKEQDATVIKAVTLINHLIDRVRETFDLDLGDMRDLETIHYELMNAFAICRKAHLDDDGKIHCCGHTSTVRSGKRSKKQTTIDGYATGSLGFRSFE